MASHVSVRSGGAGGHVSLSGGGTGHVNLVDKRWDIVIYGPPNRALAGILMSDNVGRIVGDYTQLVAETYMSMLGSRTREDTRPSKQGKLHLVDTVTAYMNPGDGYKNDRWVGVVQVGSEQNPYGGADEFGRNAYAQYWGSADLTEALRMHLPHKP